MSVEQRLELERQDRDYESLVARLHGRRKFTGCHECGSPDGMQKVHRDTLMGMKSGQVAGLAWYAELGNDREYLFYPCLICNPIVPDIFEALSLADVLDWLDLPWLARDPMAPDYEALAARSR